MSKLRYGCIGAGKISHKKHLSVYAARDDIEMVSVCDKDICAAGQAAEKYGIRSAYRSYEEMLENEKLDFVSICTPNNVHAEISIKAIEKGLHVHCEKPVGMNTEEVILIQKAADKHGIIFMPGLNFRFSKEAEAVSKCISSGMLGEIYHAKCGWVRRSGIPGKGAWFTIKDLSGGGPLIDLGVHYLDLVMNFMNYPECKLVSAHTYTNFANSPSRIREGYSDKGDGIFDVEDTALGLISLKNGASVFFEFSWASNIEAETRYFELLGTKGGICSKNGIVKYFGEKNGQKTDRTILQNTEAVKGVEQSYFIECIRTGNKPGASLEQTVRLMSIIEAAYLSASTGEPEKPLI